MAHAPTINDGLPQTSKRVADAAFMLSRWLNGYMHLDGLPKPAISHRTPSCLDWWWWCCEKSAATNQPVRVDRSSSVNTAAAMEKPHTTTAYVVYRSELRSWRSLLPRFRGQMTASGKSLVCRCLTMPDSMYDNILQMPRQRRPTQNNHIMVVKHKH